MRYYIVDDRGDIIAESGDRDTIEIKLESILDGSVEVEYQGTLEIFEEQCYGSDNKVFD